MKNKIFKNLFQSLSFWASAVVLAVPCIIGIISSLKADEIRATFIIAGAWACYVLFSFIIGFFWFFKLLHLKIRELELV